MSSDKWKCYRCGKSFVYPRSVAGRDYCSQCYQVVEERLVRFIDKVTSMSDPEFEEWLEEELIKWKLVSYTVASADQPAIKR